jgi:leucyl-tRNA synthetase
MVLQDFGFRRDLLTSLDELDQWPEKVRTDAEELDRQIGRPASLRWESPIRTLAGGANDIEVYTTRPDTLYGASFMAIAADHPMAKEARGANPAMAEFCDQCRRAGTSLAALETAEKKGFDPVNVVHPLDPGLDGPGLHRQFRADGLRHRRHLRLPFRRPARPGFCPQVQSPVTPVVMPADADAASFVITDEAYVGDGVMINSAIPRWHDAGPGVRCGRGPWKSQHSACAAGRTQGELPPARLGLSRQRYWGCADPGHPLR